MSLVILVMRPDSSHDGSFTSLKATLVCMSSLNHTPFSFSAGARIEEFLYEKLDRKAPSRLTNAELLGHYMLDAAKDFGPGTPYGQSRSVKR